jgi:hypothetical protein
VQVRSLALDDVAQCCVDVEHPFPYRGIRARP